MVRNEAVTTRSANVQGKIVIFPLYTFTLQLQGCKIIQTADKQSNRKLNEYLLNANIMKAISAEELKLPDIAIFSNGKWVEYFSDEGETPVRLYTDTYEYVYYPALLPSNYEVDISFKINGMKHFVLQYSGAKIQIR